MVRPLALCKGEFQKRQTIPITSQFNFTFKISDASLQRLHSIMPPRGFLSQMLQFPRCIQDLYIVSLLFQAVSADCFLFKHKSHLLTPNCCVCLFLQISPALLHLLKSRICIFKISACCSINTKGGYTTFKRVLPFCESLLFEKLPEFIG